MGDDLRLSVLDVDNQLQTISIVGGWEQYALAGGTDGL
jgi:hypothetical protein